MKPLLTNIQVHIHKNCSATMVLIKSKPDYVDTTDVDDFKPLPKYGHLSEKTPEFLAVEPDIKAMYDMLWEKCPDLPSFRTVAGNRDAPMPPGGPDRYAEVRTEFLKFNARDGHEVELKVYKSPNVAPEATLVYRMHGGGMYSYSILLYFTSRVKPPSPSTYL